jgi:hypothetical protein
MPVSVSKSFSDSKSNVAFTITNTLAFTIAIIDEEC